MNRQETLAEILRLSEQWVTETFGGNLPDAKPEGSMTIPFQETDCILVSFNLTNPHGEVLVVQVIQETSLMRYNVTTQLGSLLWSGIIAVGRIVPEASDLDLTALEDNDAPAST